jgi:hypothetical protein
VSDWLTAHPRWSFQFTPTHASWLNSEDGCGCLVRV